MSAIIVTSDNDEECIESLGPAGDWLGGDGSAVSAPDNIVLATGSVGNWYWLLGVTMGLELVVLLGMKVESTTLPCSLLLTYMFESRILICSSFGHYAACTSVVKSKFP